MSSGGKTEIERRSARCLNHGTRTHLLMVSGKRQGSGGLDDDLEAKNAKENVVEDSKPEAKRMARAMSLDYIVVASHKGWSEAECKPRSAKYVQHRSTHS